MTRRPQDGPALGPAAGPVAGPAVGLVVAKAPVPGRVKTRLGASAGPDAAARLAAAALLDTLDACVSAFGAARCYLALDGDLADAADAEHLTAAMASWTVLPQRGDGFAARLTHAHRDVAAKAHAPVVQVGMDTPQATGEDLRRVADLLHDGADAVLGPAEDGGWWVLGLARPAWADALTGIAMSTARTGAETRAALEAAGAVVVTGPSMRDVDDVDDAAHVAELAPDTRFAQCWALCSEQALAGGVRR